MEIKLIALEGWVGDLSMGLCSWRVSSVGMGHGLCVHGLCKHLLSSSVGIGSVDTSS